MKSFFLFLISLTTSLSIAAMAMRSKSQIAEFHFQVCETNNDVIKNKLQKLELKLEEEKKMQVYYFDDRSLGLYRQNLIIRLRLKEQKAHLTIKYRTQESYNSKKDFGICEWDVYRQSRQRSCSLSHDLSLEEAQKLILNPEGLVDILNEEEKLFIKNYDLNIHNMNFLALGFVSATKFQFTNQWVFEGWAYDEKTTLKEISWRGESTDLSATYQKQLIKLRSVGLNICPTELKKTKFTLDYFLKRNN